MSLDRSTLIKSISLGTLETGLTTLEVKTIEIKYLIINVIKYLNYKCHISRVQIL